MKIPLTLLPLFCVVPFAMSSCDGYGEDAGEKVDDAIDKIGDKADDAADEVEDAVEDAGDKIEDATDGK